MGDYLKVKPHSRQKYTILDKYLRACENFARKYGNFFYVDTHGGSGIVEMEGEGSSKSEGSPLIAAKVIETWKGGGAYPCHIIEINPEYYEVLKQAFQEKSWVKIYLGDCNDIAPSVVNSFPNAWAFGLCFMDPNGLVYDGPGASGLVYQLIWSTVEQISQREKVELLINFPLEAILRCSGFCQEHPDNRASVSMADRLTKFFGTDDWWPLQEKREFLELYLNRLQNKLGFPYVGAYLVCSQGLTPVYYLVFATRHEVGAKIMRDVMRNEWKAQHPKEAEKAKRAKWEPNLSYFIFDNELTLWPRYPSNWEEIAHRVKENAGWRCQKCGHSHDPAANYILTVYPRDGNWANTSSENLVALCQRCHLRARKSKGARQLSLDISF
jgi:three-Cys-motif partner protein